MNPWPRVFARNSPAVNDPATVSRPRVLPRSLRPPLASRQDLRTRCRAMAPSSPGTDAAREAGFYLAGMALTRALSFVMVPVYAHHLGARELGVLELLDTADLAAVTLFSAALADPVIRHVRAAPDEASRRRVVSTTILALCVLGALVGALGIAAAPWLATRWIRDPARVGVLALTFASVAFQGIIEVPLAILRGEGRAGAFVAWTVSRAALGFALNILFVVELGMGVAGIVLSSFTTSALFATVLSARTLRDVGFVCDLGVLRRLWSFGWPLVPGALSLLAMQHTRPVHLNAFCTLEEVGVWSLGARFGALVSTSLGSPLRNAWTARMYAIWEAPAGPSRYARAGTVFVAIYASAALGLSLLAPQLIVLVAPSSFEAARRVIPSVAAGYALKETGEYFRNGLLVAGNARALAWFEPAVALVDALLGWYLVRRWGFVGALAVGPLVFLGYALGLHAAARRVLPIRYEYRPIGAIVGAAVALGFVGSRVHTGMPIADGVLRFVLALVLPAACLVAAVRAAGGTAALRRIARRW